MFCFIDVFFNNVQNYQLRFSIFQLNKSEKMDIYNSINIKTLQTLNNKLKDKKTEKIFATNKIHIHNTIHNIKEVVNIHKKKMGIAVKTVFGYENQQNIP